MGDVGSNSISNDPLLRNNFRNVIQEGDFMILAFADGRQIFAQALKSWKGKAPPVKINKRSYPTHNLVGLPYGTVLELGSSRLMPLPEDEDVIPEYPSTLSSGTDGGAASAKTPTALEDDEAVADDNTFPSVDTDQSCDNRNLVDDNQSQRLAAEDIERLRQSGARGSEIVDKLIENSATFGQKTEFSKAKWIAKKQLKYQPRCRIVRCTPFTVCEALFRTRPRSLLNMREDSLGQILSYSNVSAGCQVLVYEQCMGVVTGAIAQRMGGYGKVLSVYTGQQPNFLEIISRYNLSFAEHFSIKWVHAGDIFGDPSSVAASNAEISNDPEKLERQSLEWPCPLQDHTRSYLDNMGTEQEKRDFLAKRCSRFARKLTRHTPEEGKEWLQKRQSDSVILAVRCDPTETLLGMLPYLAPSCPFVVFCEYKEPLADCFQQLQKQQLAINLRLSDAWMREFQVLPGRTHPDMNMTQSGGYILTGIKLCPNTGKNELDDDLLKEIKQQMNSRRGRKKNKAAASKNGPKRSRQELDNVQETSSKKPREES